MSALDDLRWLQSRARGHDGIPIEPDELTPIIAALEAEMRQIQTERDLVQGAFNSVTDELQRVQRHREAEASHNEPASPTEPAYFVGVDKAKGNDYSAEVSAHTEDDTLVVDSVQITKSKLAPTLDGP